MFSCKLISEKTSPKKVRGFSLVEILGAVSVLAVLASIAFISVKDSVQAGQRAAAQRELQALNTSLQNFKSAGGVIPETTDPDIALSSMKEGVGVAGSHFIPTITDPPASIQIAGETLDLEYDPEEGFKYGKDNGGGFSSGGQEASGIAGASYPFDISNPSAVAAAIEELRGIHAEDPRAEEYLLAFKDAAKLGYLSFNDIDNLSNIYALPAESSFFGPPPLARRLPADIFAMRIDAYNSLLAQGTPEERATAAQKLRNDFGAMFWQQFSLTATGIFYSPAENMKGADWSKVNLTGTSWLSGGTSGIILKDVQGLSLQQFGPTNINTVGLKGINMTGYDTTGRTWHRAVLDQPVGFTGEQLNNLASISQLRLYNTGVSGYNPAEKNLSGFVFNNVTGINMASLQNAQLSGASFHAVDMTGFSAAGKNMNNVKMVNAIISADQLAAATSLQNMDLRGTGVTESALRNAGYNGSLSGTLFGPKPAAFSSSPWGGGNALNSPY